MTIPTAKYLRAGLDYDILAKPDILRRLVWQGLTDAQIGERAGCQRRHRRQLAAAIWHSQAQLESASEAPPGSTHHPRAVSGGGGAGVPGAIRKMLDRMPARGGVR